MRRTRFMSLLFVVLSLAFFFVREFRQGLQTPLLGLAFRANAWEVLERAGALPAARLQELARTAERERDARTLAFVALNSEDVRDAARLTDQAVTLDRQFTWLYWILAMRHRFLVVGERPEPILPLEEWSARVRAWDPNNAVVYLLEAERVHGARRLDRYPGTGESQLEALTKETAWQGWMEKAFAAPLYDSYVREWFGLQRALLREHDLDSPVVVMTRLASYPIPNVLNIRQYLNLLAEKQGKEAERAGRLAEAAEQYWQAAHFAERMQVGSGSLLEKLFANAFRTIAYERLVPILRRLGRNHEATFVGYAVEELRQQREILSGRDPLAQSSNYNWSALLVHVFATLVVVFGVFTLVCVGYVNAKRWVRPEQKGRLYQFLTVAENYAPLLLFFACLGLYISYYPYAQNYSYYMTAGGKIYNFEPLFYNTFPTFGIVPGRTVLPLQNPFVPYVWYALGGLVLLAAVVLFARRQRQP